MTGQIVGVILSGGRSLRMGGGDKALLAVAGRPMLWHVIHRLAPQVDRMALSANGDPTRFAMFGLPVLADTIPDYPGPLAGVLAGMEWAGDLPRCTHVATAAADSPFFPKDHVARLIAGNDGSENRIVYARCGARDHPLFALWPVSMSNSLREFLEEGGSLRVMDFIESVDHAAIAFAPVGSEGTDPFFNINTPEDMAAAERLAAELAG